MQTLIMSLIVLALMLSPQQGHRPDLTKREDLIALGSGKIIEKDRSIIKNITLHEVKEYWIVYVKNGSIHDLLMEKIDRIEFNESKWGRIKLEFPDGKPKISEILN